MVERFNTLTYPVGWKFECDMTNVKHSDVQTKDHITLSIYLMKKKSF